MKFVSNGYNVSLKPDSLKNSKSGTWTPSGTIFLTDRMTTISFKIHLKNDTALTKAKANSVFRKKAFSQ